MHSQNKQIEVDIERLSADGLGVGHYQPQPDQRIRVQAPFTYPGDRALLSVGRKRRGSALGLPLSILRPSPDRVAPRCIHSSSCGGCLWQEFDYPAQLKQKEEQIRALFAPLIEKDRPTIHPIIPCASPWAYRNKMEFTFSQNKAGERFLGLILGGSKGRVFNLTECHLVSPWFAAALRDVRRWWEQSGLEAYFAPRDAGALRTLTLREGKQTGDKMAILTVSGNPAHALSRSAVEGFIQAVKRALPPEEHPRLSLFLRIQQVGKGKPTQFFEMHLGGPDHITEKLEVIIDGKPKTLLFKISPTAFFQPNTLQAQTLYTRALQLLAPSPDDRLLDLYAGTATLSLILALKAKEVTAVELNPYAIFDAQTNLELNAITNVSARCGDVAALLPSLPLSDAIVVDPPRSGLMPQATQQILALKPKKILYISCNPKTQAENLQKLLEGGAYRLEQLQPIDQFPHTIHVENIALLRAVFP